MARGPWLLFCVCCSHLMAVSSNYTTEAHYTVTTNAKVNDWMVQCMWNLFCLIGDKGDTGSEGPTGLKGKPGGCIDFLSLLIFFFHCICCMWQHLFEAIKKMSKNYEKQRQQTIWCHTHSLSFLQAQRATVAATGRWLDSWMSLLANWGVLSSSSRLVSSRHGSVNTRHSGGWTAAGTGSYLYKQQLTGLWKKKKNNFCWYS